jgi:hypothetical protein
MVQDPDLKYFEDNWAIAGILILVGWIFHIPNIILYDPPSIVLLVIAGVFFMLAFFFMGRALWKIRT